MCSSSSTTAHPTPTGCLLSNLQMWNVCHKCHWHALSKKTFPMDSANSLHKTCATKNVVVVFHLFCTRHQFWKTEVCVLANCILCVWFWKTQQPLNNFRSFWGARMSTCCALTSLLIWCHGFFNPVMFLFGECSNVCFGELNISLNKSMLLGRFCHFRSIWGTHRGPQRSHEIARGTTWKQTLQWQHLRSCKSGSWANERGNT